MIGLHDRRATLQSRVLTPDGGGGFIENWEAFGSAWVVLTPLGMRDRFGPDAVETRVSHRILLRRREDLAAGQRLFVGSRIFKVRAVLDKGPRTPFVTLLCEELP